MSDIKTVKIFVASSNELKEEREKCVLWVNYLNNSHRHLMLKPIEWEFEMTYGNFPGFENVQDAINPRLKESDIVLFLFYSKIGRYTKEEFDLAIREGKKIFPFFKKGYSPTTTAVTKTYQQLLRFKEKFDGMILPVEYSDINDFQGKLYIQLNQYLADHYSKKANDIEESRLSENNILLMRELTEKQAEIKRLQEANESSAIVSVELIDKLKKEKHSLHNKLTKYKEIKRLRIKDKAVLGRQLDLQKEHDPLKAKALKALEKDNYDKTEEYLKQSAKENIKAVADTFYELAKLNEIKLQYKESLDYYELAIKIDPENSVYLNEAGLLAKTLGLYDKAISHYERELALYKKYYNKEHPDIANCYNNLGEAYRSIGEYDKAAQYLTKSLRMNKKIYDKEHPHIAVNYSILGLIYFNKHDHKKAIDYLQKAYEIDRNHYGENHPTIAIRCSNLGKVYLELKDYDTALDYLQKAIDIDKKHYDEDHPKFAIRYNNFGLVYTDKKEYHKAIGYFEKALSIFNKYFPNSHPRVQECIKNRQAAQAALDMR